MANKEYRLFRYNPITGFWKYERSCARGSEEKWLFTFYKTEEDPDAIFRLSLQKPTGRPTNKDKKVKGKIMDKINEDKLSKVDFNKIANNLKKLANENFAPYYTVVIPWAEADKRTPWHPTEKKGPFSKLSRGSFKSEEEAHAWAKEHLKGNPYEVRKVASSKKTAAKEKKTYVTTFCNFPHDVNTGRPINHECYILPPAALKAEMEGDYETAQEILHKNRGKMRMVNPRKTKDASIKTAEEQIYHVALDNIEWDTDDDEVNLPSHLTGKTRASSEEEAIERIIERASDNYDYLIFDAEAKAIIYKPKKASTKKTAAEPNHKALLDFVEKDVEESLVNVQKALKKVNDMATEQGIFELIEKEMGIVNKSLYNAVQNILKVELIIAQKVEGKK